LVPFTDGDCHFIMLDADIRPTGAAELEPSPEEMYSLLDSYFEAVNTPISINRVNIFGATDPKFSPAAY
jgi:hypothetical protein